VIKEFEFFHGVVFARLFHRGQQVVSIRAFDPESNAAYVVDDSIGIYVKYSSKRMTPWRFTFSPEHKREIERLRGSVPKVFIVLVCNDDGIACLSYSELKTVLNDQHETHQWISATRHKREMYSIEGSNGRLESKVGKDDFPNKIFCLDRKAASSI
jgi:hypothetical protein